MGDATTTKTVIAGGSGFLGLNLARHLSAIGHEVVILSRTAPSKEGRWRHVAWDGASVGSWATELDGTTALVNLAGRTVDCVKTPENCDEILRSRVDSTRALGKAVREVANPPSVWVQMSTAHIYGDSPTQQCDEHSTTGLGLAPTVGLRWEEAFAESIPPSVRGVILRTSFVLGRSGGALSTLKRLVRSGLGGKVGHGRQGISWIHESDMNQLFEQAISNNGFQGMYVASAPKPVSNATFMKTLRRSLAIPIGLPTPGILVRIGAPLIGTDPDLALYGRFVVSQRLKDQGFRFAFPDVKTALEDLS